MTYAVSRLPSSQGSCFLFLIVVCITVVYMFLNLILTLINCSTCATFLLVRQRKARKSPAVMCHLTDEKSSVLFLNLPPSIIGYNFQAHSCPSVTQNQGRWHKPTYSLRRQAELVKKADPSRSMNLLPLGPGIQKSQSESYAIWLLVSWIACFLALLHLFNPHLLSCSITRRENRTRLNRQDIQNCPSCCSNVLCSYQVSAVGGKLFALLVNSSFG